jgi:F-type H+-transporting ATPase subunit delta
MDQSKINVRYAKAFFTLAKEKGLTIELRKDAGLVASVCESSSDFILMLESPVVKTSKKAEALKLIFEDKVNVLSLNFLLLIIENKRESYIPGIFRNLEDLYRHEEGIKSAVLTSAQPLNDALVLQIRKTLETEFNAKVELRQKVDVNLIGGFVLRVEDKQYDASLSTQLKKIREQLLHTELK